MPYKNKTVLLESQITANYEQPDVIMLMLTHDVVVLTVPSKAPENVTVEATSSTVSYSLVLGT